jgi:hypothetical protein
MKNWGQTLEKKSVFDLVILHAVRQHTTAGLTVSDVTTQAIKELTGSMVILGEPQG